MQPSWSNSAPLLPDHKEYIISERSNDTLIPTHRVIYTRPCLVSSSRSWDLSFPVRMIRTEVDSGIPWQSARDIDAISVLYFISFALKAYLIATPLLSLLGEKVVGGGCTQEKPEIFQIQYCQPSREGIKAIWQEIITSPLFSVFFENLDQWSKKRRTSLQDFALAVTQWRTCRLGAIVNLHSILPSCCEGNPMIQRRPKQSNCDEHRCLPAVGPGITRDSWATVSTQMSTFSMDEREHEVECNIICSVTFSHR